MSRSHRAPVVVTGANGFVGGHVCRMLARSGAAVRAVVRRSSRVPLPAGVQGWVGDFGDATFADAVVAGAAAVVTTVHPMAADRATQHRVGVTGTVVLARAAARAGVRRLVHVSTAAVYERTAATGTVDESSPLVADPADDYAASKRDADRALGEVAGLTRVLVRPPAIVGPGPTSTWNSLRPARMLVDEAARRAVPEATFAWVHVRDVARFVSDVATGRITASTDPDRGPVDDHCTPVNLVAGCATLRDYHEVVSAALGCDPVWADEPAWTGRLTAERARAWGWAPTVDLERALSEIRTAAAIRQVG